MLNRRRQTARAMKAKEDGEKKEGEDVKMEDADGKEGEDGATKKEPADGAP